ncbi:Amuc_1098 family type IV pilus outer membrane protein [Prosthecobacter sp.]|uniref:Amuc_1098 family type IV pilus outer membrane protein n=1 Tax=Prosthecobacter sp. TaxID=1965333 RepID=UPI003783A96A
MPQLPSPQRSAPQFFRCLPSRGLVACLSVILVSASVRTTQAQSVSAMAQAEARRRALQVNKLNEDIERGYQLIDQGKSAEALALFVEVYKAVPDIPLAKASRLAARDGYVVAGSMQVQDLAAKGDLAAASKLLDEMLAPEVAPNDSRLVVLKKRLGDPDRFPPALTRQHVENVGAVQTLLIKGNSFLQIGDPDKAISTFQDVLRMDPYNSAARRGMENAEREKQKYFKSAYDHQRSKMLSAVQQTWEDPVPLTATDRSALFGAGSAALVNQQTGSDRITQKLRSIIFPHVDFSGVTLEEVVELLRVRSHDLDPEGKGISFVISVPPESRTKPISLNIYNVPMEEVLRYVSEMCGVSYKVDEHAVIFVSLSERNNVIISRTFRVPPDFIQSSPGAGPPAGGGNDPFAAQTPPPGGALVIRRMGAKEFLESRGVTFPEGTTASYSAATNTLMVRNTLLNMETVEMIVEQAAKASPKMAVIHVRMLEVNQTNLDELGFDWLMGGVGTNGNNLFFGGGTAGNGVPYNSANYPFSTPYTIPSQVVNGLTVFPAIPINGSLAGPIPSGTTAPFPYGGGPLTSGLRTGSYATTADSIDTLLKTGSVTQSQASAPGVLSVAGVFTDPQFQTVLRALSQKKGVDVNASPSVTTKSGLKATAEITQEFIYPTEFDPPRLPQGGGGGTIRFGGGGGGGAQPPMIATPTTPTAFEMRKTGVLVEVEPVISEDGRTVELTISPELTTFEGFVNYGSPILSPAAVSVVPIQLGAAGTTTVGTTGYVPISNPDNLITPNLILQPIFKVQKVTTAVKIYDGATVVLGGAKIQKHTLVEDKVPILGDMPFVGRMFKANTKQTDTKNIVIFVTVEVVDPSGQRVNRDNGASATASVVK